MSFIESGGFYGPKSDIVVAPSSHTDRERLLGEVDGIQAQVDQVLGESALVSTVQDFDWEGVRIGPFQQPGVKYDSDNGWY